MDQISRIHTQIALDLQVLETELAELPELSADWNTLHRTERFVAALEWDDLLFGRWVKLAKAVDSMTHEELRRFSAVNTLLATSLPVLSTMGIGDGFRTHLDTMMPVHA